jgi:predicted PurR-regulated permease PerM
VLLNRGVNFLVSRKINRVLAIVIVIIFSIVVLIAGIYLLSMELTSFKSTLPKMESRFNEVLNNATDWGARKFHLSKGKINGWYASTRVKALAGANSMIGETLLTITDVLVLFILIPVYLFMILYYKPLLIKFFQLLFTETHQEKVEHVLFKSKAIVQSYLNGLLIEALLVATLNSIALILLGIDYAILLGVIGALLNIIPFIGGILSVALPLLLAFTTKDSISYPLLVIISYMLIQFIDNHYITPKIVASKVKINALMAIIVVLIGNGIWGIPGMFLSIPVAGILKLIFEQIEELRAWAFLLGDTMPLKIIYRLKLRGRKK